MTSVRVPKKVVTVQLGNLENILFDLFSIMRFIQIIRIMVSGYCSLGDIGKYMNQPSAGAISL